MENRLCILVADGVEEMELVVPVDIFRRVHMPVTIVSATEERHITSAHGIHIVADRVLSEVSIDDFDGIVLPGGPSSFTLKDQPAVLNFVKSFHEHDRWIAAICAAPLILKNAGVLNGQSFCAHPCTYETLSGVNTEKEVVVDGHLITAKGPGVAADFGLAIVDQIMGRQVAIDISEEMFL